MDEYLVRMVVVDEKKVINMEVITNVLNKVLTASGVRIVQWGKKEVMLDALMPERIDRVIIVDGKQIYPTDKDKPNN